jgi:hypothetical protein
VTETTEVQARPELIHAGTYALYRTPAGAYHVVYKRTQSTDEDGQVLDIEGAPDQHLRDLPERWANMIGMILDRDVPLPPVFAALLDGKMPSPMDMLRLRKAAEDAVNGDGDAPA